MIKFCFTFLLLLFTTVSFSQNLMGIVYDVNGVELPGTLILIEENKTTIYTDEEGGFEIDTKGFNTITLTFHAIGHEVLVIQIPRSNYSDFHTIKLEDIQLNLEEIQLVAKRQKMHGYTTLRAVEGTSIYSSKKAEVVDMESINANLATNATRQIFSKISGLNIWESDCSGLQLGVGSRGLSPSRTSNFNVRQNGYDISADAIGYPDAYFAPPMQALESIEVIKGAASLQYGTQFGGLIDFKIKEAVKNKKIELKSSITLGSYKYLNTFNRLSGTIGKFSYNSYYQYRSGDCYRCNSEFDYHSTYLNTKYQINPKLSISAEYSYLQYLAHQPGGLTDKLFQQDSRQSIRNRNWFKIFWNLLNTKVVYTISPRTTLESFVLGQYSGRDASGFLGLISRTDPLDETTLLQDTYKNLISETKLLHRYTINDQIHIFLVGMRYMQGTTTKKQGYTSNDSIATFKYERPERLEGSDYLFPNKNLSIFTENVFNLNDKFSIIIGARYEYINQLAKGYYALRNYDFAGNLLIDTSFQETKNITRNFPFFGGGISYKYNKSIEFYTNFSENYRAVGYNDIRIVNPNLVIDPHLEDERGYNFDIGIKANSTNQLFLFNTNFFILKYKNKIGTYFTKLPDPILFNKVVRYRTNMSQAISYGIELFGQVDLYKLFMTENIKNNPISFSTYLNLSLINARYTDSKQTAFYGKKIEEVPPFTSRLGFDFSWKNFRAGTQFSYTYQHYSDATNATFVPDATVGIIPSYYTMDFNATYNWDIIGLQLAINNFTNNKYFTRRADGYPGPGILPSEPINANFTFSIKL